MRQPANVGQSIVRGAAAILVVLGHARWYSENEAGYTLTSGPGWKLIMLPTSFAQEGVGIFFVLSGYLVGGQVLRELRENRFTWRSYASKRLSRLWTVLVPGLVVTLVIDLLARHLGDEWYAIRGLSDDHAATFACNSAFLQGVHCRWYGSNDSLWSLSFEFWFYFLFAGLAAAVVSRQGMLPRLVGTAVAAGALGVFGWQLLEFIPSWLFGVALAVLHARGGDQASLDACPPAAARRRFLLPFSDSGCFHRTFSA